MVFKARNYSKARIDSRKHDYIKSGGDVEVKL